MDDGSQNSCVAQFNESEEVSISDDGEDSGVMKIGIFAPRIASEEPRGRAQRFLRY